MIQEVDFNILQKLFDNGMTLGVMGIIIWIIWKRDERYRKSQDEKLASLEARFQTYLEKDMRALQEQLDRSNEMQKETNHVIHESNEITKITNRILACFTTEMNTFKNSDIYLAYLKNERSERFQNT